MSDDQKQTGFCLLKLQIGPVQEFIAQARSTRDLWSGSYLLSWLMAAGLQHLEKAGADIIYPAWANQPLRQVRRREKDSLDFKVAAIPSRNIKFHSGGWLPNWISPENGDVLLKEGNTSRHEYEGRVTWRERVRQQNSINASLVAAIVPKPIVVTGYAVADRTNEIESERNGGAQSTQLAVPAGAVYYFEADSAADAQKLAAALNWDGTTEGREIKNRRSTLLGEKGFGLGVCGTWNFIKDAR